MLGDIPRLILVAKQDIAAQTELLYDYGDRSDRRGRVEAGGEVTFYNLKLAICIYVCLLPGVRRV